MQGVLPAQDLAQQMKLQNIFFYFETFSERKFYHLFNAGCLVQKNNL